MLLLLRERRLVATPIDGDNDDDDELLMLWAETRCLAVALDFLRLVLWDTLDMVVAFMSRTHGCVYIQYARNAVDGSFSLYSCFDLLICLEIQNVFPCGVYYIIR